MPEETSTTTTKIEPEFQVVNTGSSSVPLGQLTIRYWFTSDTASLLTAACNYASLGCSTITETATAMAQPAPGADSYLQVGFTSGTLNGASDTGKIKMRVNHADGSNFDQSDDYSFNGSFTSFTAWQNVTLYQNGTLIWGTEPNGNTATPTATTGTTPTPTATTGTTPTPTPTTGITPTPTPTSTPITGTPVTVLVNSASNGNVGTGFAGFSYEKDRVGAGMFDVQDTNLVNLFKLLGPSVLRLGGNLVDIVNWNASGSGGSASEIAPSDVTKLAAFIQATGWKVLYGINLKTNTPANAASEAQFAAQALGSNLLAFEIGNEPDFYMSESAYESSFNSYVSAIKAKVPNAVFDGPGGSDHNPGWATTFAAHEKNNSLVMLATHMYIGDKTTATISGMLGSNASGKLPNGESTLGSAKSANGIPQWRMTEANSYFHGGAAGVSNVEAASLWSLDFMYGIASHNGDGVNFHGGTSTQFTLNYSPIAFSGLNPTGVQGVYYGELLWEMAGTGSLHAASVSGGSSITAWGIGNNVVVNNKGTSAIAATITLPSSASSASEYILTAPSLSSTAITIAGSGVSASGAFSPTQQPVSVSGNKVVISVPAGSAALVVTQ
jgi:hypothetical protein